MLLLPFAPSITLEIVNVLFLAPSKALQLLSLVFTVRTTILSFQFVYRDCKFPTIWSFGRICCILVLLYFLDNYNFTFCVILFFWEFCCNFFIKYSKFSSVLNNDRPHNPISDLLTSWHFCVHIGLTGMLYAIFYPFLSIEEQRSNPFCHLKLITVWRLLVCIIYLPALTWVCTIKYEV